MLEVGEVGKEGGADFGRGPLQWFVGGAEGGGGTRWAGGEAEGAGGGGEGPEGGEGSDAHGDGDGLLCCSCSGC